LEREYHFSEEYRNFGIRYSEGSLSPLEGKNRPAVCNQYVRKQGGEDVTSRVPKRNDTWIRARMCVKKGGGQVNTQVLSGQWVAEGHNGVL